jgi:pyridoxamine 5'-phosphate oxidase
MKSVRKIHHLRSAIVEEVLDEKNLPASPLALFDLWMEKAIENVPEPTAFTLATADKKGKPSARVVLLKGYNPEGFVFFTNYNSKKSAELLQNKSVSVVFYWPQIHKQIRIEGRAEKTSTAESNEYFKSRPRESQLGALASEQSQVLLNRKALEERYEILERKYLGKKIPRPAHWGGYRIVPDYFEFWQSRTNRLHDRIVYKKIKGNTWRIFRLSP